MLSESSIWLKENNENLFYCPHYKAQLTKQSCEERRQVYKQKASRKHRNTCKYCGGWKNPILNFPPMTECRGHFDFNDISPMDCYHVHL